MLALITGPVRSGKSAYAARIAAEIGGPLTYVATARLDPTDAEMADRVARHRADRDPSIRVVEVWGEGHPDLPALVAAAPAGHVLVVDSLGTWLAGHLLDLEALADRDATAALAQLEAVTRGLVPSLQAVDAHVIVVAEETGWGIVPTSALGRIFRDHLGRLTAAIAAIADRAELVVAGYALDLKAGRPVRPERG
jgi:adenosylcobinamide kinase/adenosylcobinamide-phosphate guanylyltransferase